MPDAPDCPDQRRAADASMARDNGADRHYMIGVTGMPHTQHKSERHDREQTNQIFSVPLAAKTCVEEG
jgi:hypothetical protein